MYTANMPISSHTFGQTFSIDFPLRLFWVVTGHPIHDIPEESQQNALNECIQIYLSAMKEELATTFNKKTAFQLLHKLHTGTLDFTEQKQIHTAHTTVIHALAFETEVV